MKPRNRREREVARLSRLVPSLTYAQFRWIEENVVGRYGYCTKRVGWCSSCGETFDVPPGTNADDEMECPHCHRKMTVRMSRLQKTRSIKYVQILTTCRSWQVIRYFEVEWRCHKGWEKRLYIREVIQKWCKPGQRMVTLCRNIVAYPYRCWSPFSQYGDFSVKESDWATEWMEVILYPTMRVLPFYKKVGFDGSLPVNAEDLFGKVFSNPFTEMCFKTKRNDMLRDALKHDKLVNEFWPSIRVALRHKFEIRSLNDYLDYLGMLKYLKKDLHNPKFVAPADYAGMHYEIVQLAAQKREREMEIQRRKWEEERIARNEEEMKRLEKEKAEFAARIAKFANLDITDGTIDIRPLMTIDEFAAEGEAMHHCVYSNEYFAEKDSLILSAKIDGKRIETIEVDMTDFSIAQSRGACNKPTDYHDAIVALMMSGMPLVEKMSGRKRKQAAYACA